MSRPEASDAESPGIFVREGDASAFRERFVYRRAQGEGGGYLVVDDAWFPGWRATVDGQETDVERANVHFKAVWVPPGAQEVVLSYEPAPLQRGLLISLGALLLAVLLFIRGRLW